MDNRKYCKLIQRYIKPIGPSTLRNQECGVARAAREFINGIDLSQLANVADADYNNWLNDRTTELMRQFPAGARDNWGAARKAINLLMIKAYFNKVLSAEYNLCRFKDVLETPLDGKAAKKLKEFARETLDLELQFPGIKHLTPQVSEKFQEVASKYARREGIPRAELDIILWVDKGVEAGDRDKRT